MTRRLGDLHFVLFFTRGLSLKSWDEAGLFDREISIYRELGRRLGRISLVTYGNHEESIFRKRLDGLRLICNRWNLSTRNYTFLLTHVHPFFWRDPVVLKTNQVLGADVALEVARRFGKKLVTRCGYLPSNLEIWAHGTESPEAQAMRDLEAAVFQGADRVAVTTAEMRDTIVDRYGVNERKITVIPNFVDTERFRPKPECREDRRVCYVGRLHPEKNVEALIEATRGLELELEIAGDGPLRSELTEKVRREHLPVRFLGSVPNSQLPAVLQRVCLFVLPSHLEHQPKALLEAMACGVAVVGTDVPGTRQLIRHRETGYLCGTSADEIRSAMQDLLSDHNLRRHLGSNAREFVVEHFALEHVMELECTLLEGLVS